MAVTPAERWRDLLLPRLNARQEQMRLMDDYYRGDHPLPFVTKAHQAKLRDEFRNMLEDSRSNFMRLVVEAVEERLKVDGFRLSALDSKTDDRASWAVWQANQMDAQSQVAFSEALVKGVSYLSVWGPSSPDGYPTIAVEDPLQTIVAYETGSNNRRRAAALKVWRDEWTGMERANVYLPDGIYKWERQVSTALPQGTTWSMTAVRSGGWQWLEEEPAFVPNPVGVVPIVPLANRPRLGLEGESELADLYRIQNQINGFLFLMALAGYMGAHRQRWATGLEIMVNEQTGKPIEPFNSAVDRLWATENPQVKFGEFSQTDLDGYLKAIEQKVQHIADISKTPRHMLVQQGQSPSGDAIKSAESGLVKKVERRQMVFGEGLEEALRVARRFAGETDTPVDSEVIWADPSIKTEGEVTDAVIKKWGARLISWQQALIDLGYSATEIERMLNQFGSVPEPPSSSPQGAATV